MIKRPDINQYLIDLGLDWFKNDKCSIYVNDDYVYRGIYDDFGYISYYRDYYLSLLDDKIKKDIYKKFTDLFKSDLICKCGKSNFNLRYYESELTASCTECNNKFQLFSN